MQNSLTQKLSSFCRLSEGNKNQLDRFCENARYTRAGTTLIHEGERPENVFLLLEGWAFRYKYLRDGSRQIMVYLIPGDLRDVQIFIRKEMDHNTGVLNDAKVAVISKQNMIEMVGERAAIGKALWWSTLVDAGILREWLINMGRRDAYKRLAHLFCHMWLCMRQVGMTRDGEFSLPLTKERLGDTKG